MTDPSGATTYTYTHRDQVASKVTPEGTLTYTYDPSGNVGSVASSNAGGTSVAYAWDADNRLSSVTDSRTNGVSTYNYDQTGQLSGMQLENGVTYGYGYDQRDRLVNLSVNGPSGTIASYTQGFSPSSRKVSVQEAPGRGVNYSYDSIYRLLTENIAGDPTAANNGSLTYSLDPVANRLSLTSTLAALPAQSNAYDADDRASSDTFDSDGNTLESGGTSYAYDFEDRLSSSSSGVQIVYDGDGNRVSETVEGVITSYLIDDLNPTGTAQVAEELVNGTVTAQYTYGLTAVSVRRNSISYYGYDGFENVRELTDNSGTVTDTYDYDAYGNAISHSGTTVNNLMYRSEYFDPAVGMYYLRARWYRPLNGRFLTADTFEGRPKHPASLNRYNYAESDPVDLVDPSGYSIEETAVLEGTDEGYDEIALARQAVIALGVTCVLVHVWNILDHANEASGGTATLPPNLLPECQDGITCDRNYPSYVKCMDIAGQGYTCPGLQSGLAILSAAWGGRPVGLKNGNTLEKGPCSETSSYMIGSHWSTTFLDGIKTKGAYPGTITCCDCCQDSPLGASGTATIESMCKVVVNHGQPIPPNFGKP